MTKKDRFRLWLTYYKSNTAYRHACATLSVSGNHLVTNSGSDNNWNLGTQVAKIFDDTFFEGEVTELYEDVDKNGKSIKWWRIKYCDGDEEDMDETEMKSARKLFLSVSRSKARGTKA